MQADPLRTVMELTLAHGGIAPIRLGPLQGWVVSEPALIAEVLTRHQARYNRQTRVYQSMADFLGKGILTTEGEDWRIHRRIVQPAFRPRRLERFAEDIVALTREHLDGWRDGQELDACDEMMRLTLKIVSQVLLGTKTEAYATAIGEAVDAGQRYSEKRISRLFLVPQSIPTPDNRAFAKAVETLDRIAYRIIDERKQSGERGDDAVSMLLDARYEDGTEVARERIRNELITLLAAGHETTANALSWTLMRLSQHPDVARKMAEEVERVLAGRDPTYEDLGKLEYVRWVFDEAMRLHPPVTMTGRMAIEAHTLGGQSIDAGDLVLISPYVTHRRPDLWENPEGFDPDRWGRQGKLPHYHFWPFGGGTRKCVGEAFAYLEAILVLAMVAQRFELHLLPHPIVPMPRITLGLAHGLRMKVRGREGSSESP